MKSRSPSARDTTTRRRATAVRRSGHHRTRRRRRPLRRMHAACQSRPVRQMLFFPGKTTPETVDAWCRRAVVWFAPFPPGANRPTGSRLASPVERIAPARQHHPLERGFRREIGGPGRIASGRRRTRSRGRRSRARCDVKKPRPPNETGRRLSGQWRDSGRSVETGLREAAGLPEWLRLPGATWQRSAARPWPGGDDTAASNRSS